MTPFQLRSKWIFELFGVEALLRPGSTRAEFRPLFEISTRHLKSGLGTVHMVPRLQRCGVSMRGVDPPNRVAKSHAKSYIATSMMYAFAVLFGMARQLHR